VSTPSDPQRGGHQPDDASRSDGGHGAPEPDSPGQQQGGDAGQYGQPGQYGGQPPYGQPQYGQPGQYGGQPQYGQPGQYGGQPQYGQPQYGQPGQYGGQPQYGQPQHGQPQYGQAQYGQAPYNPYAQPSQSGPYDVQSPYGYGGPAGLDKDDDGPVARPGIMIVSLVLLILSTLPFLAGGAALLTAPLDLSALPPEFGLEEQLDAAGLNAETFVSFLRGVAAGVLALALLYILFAVLAFLGRNWARIVLTIMTVLFTLLMLLGVFGGAAGETAGLLMLLLIVGASVGGTIILFLPAPSHYFMRGRGH
jgi:hypothetical protein